MKYLLSIPLIFIVTAGFSQQKSATRYTIIHEVRMSFPGHTKKVSVPEINHSDIARMPEPILALAAFYSAIAGTDCYIDTANDEVCNLTTALGLGKQGSDAHDKILKKWFKDDKEVTEILNQNCFVRVSGASIFADYSYLNFNVKEDTVEIHYQILFYDHGSSEVKKYTDKALIKKDHIQFIKR